MTMTVNPWWVILVLSLALFGVVFVWRVARAAARDLQAWWRDRREPGTEGRCICGPDETGEDIDVNPHCPEHGYGWDDEDDLEELPPERSAEALGFTGEQPAWRVRPCPDPVTHPHEPGILYTHDRRPTFLERLEARRERLASAAELEHRAAYEAMGLEYPSGLMARVREAAP